jgi:CyaY protein
VVDVECKRSGNVLEIEFIDNGSKIIVNSQAPLQEMWVAARSGGFHYKRVGDEWRNTRDVRSCLRHVVGNGAQGGSPGLA